jgi:hypothetical protein
MVSPFLAGLPQRIHMAAELTAGIDLLLDQVGLLHREEARACLASHGMGEAVVRTVTSLGVLRTSFLQFDSSAAGLIKWAYSAALFLSSSMVEHSAVNRRVVGSSPT